MGSIHLCCSTSTWQNKTVSTHLTEVQKISLNYTSVHLSPSDGTIFLLQSWNSCKQFVCTITETVCDIGSEHLCIAFPTHRQKNAICCPSLNSVILFLRQINEQEFKVIIRENSHSKIHHTWIRLDSINSTESNYTVSFRNNRKIAVKYSIVWSIIWKQLRENKRQGQKNCGRNNDIY